MRSRKLVPASESCEKKCCRTMAREWPRDAVESRLLSRSGRRLCRPRLAFSTQRVARTSVLLPAVSNDPVAPSHAAAADAGERASRRRAVTVAASAAGRREEPIMNFTRNSTPQL
jgi:hypothetical protein